ncbi:MAG: hypothetical protein AAGG08_07920, partial [Actinomycetota bacterium]
LIALLTVFTAGVALALSAANVFFRDVSHLWSIAAQLLFYATPIIWAPELTDSELLDTFTNWHPTGSFIRASHQLLYGGSMPSLARWAQLTVFAVASLAIGSWLFGRLSPRFAEEV